MSEPCLCSSGSSFDTCCGPFLRGEARPATAVELMRSRYCAFARRDIDYVIETNHPRTRKGIDRKTTLQWMTESRWLGLEVLSSKDGKEGDAHGEVEFIARFHLGGADRAHKERAEFECQDGRWYFVDGKVMGMGETIRREEPKVGRNHPCTCGSGRKWKHCHGKGAGATA
jgi:SEC-C motif-containing protein